ncbi:MAG: hypothetical protein Q9M30_05080 [Mariprofundaceae bacterium]|nr:hypothetical protein [Mariprofundaceae bacterium]
MSVKSVSQLFAAKEASIAFSTLIYAVFWIIFCISLAVYWHDIPVLIKWPAVVLMIIFITDFRAQPDKV